MAYTPLRTDFKDDILDSSNYKRKYKQVANNDGTFSFQDETTYQQVGSDYGAKEVNEEREAINNIYENKLVALDDVALVTEEGFFVDALAVKELNSKLYETYIDPSTKSICIRFPKNRIQICAGTIRVYASLQQNGTGYTGVSTKIEQATFPKPFKFLSGCTITQNSDDWVMILGKTTTLNGIHQLRLGYFAAYTNKAFYMDYIAIGTY